MKQAFGFNFGMGQFDAPHTPIQGVGVQTLAFDPIGLWFGDSNTAGVSASDQAAFDAAWTLPAKDEVLNAAGNWAQWVPGTFGGMDNLADVTAAGPESGFITKFRARYSNKLRHLKFGGSGSVMSKGASKGTITASIAGNVLNRTAGVITGNTTGGFLVEWVTGPVDGIYVLFPNGADPNWYVGKINTALPHTDGNANVTVSSQSMTAYPCFTSWSVAKGNLYSGWNNTNQNGARGKSVAALAALVSGGGNPRVAFAHIALGTNEVAGTVATYQAELTALIAAIRADFATYMPASTPIILSRVRSDASAGASCRAAQQAIADADPYVFLIDTDSYSKTGPHFDMTGLQGIGGQVFDVWHGDSVGI